MRKATLTVTVPDDQDPAEILGQMVEEYFYANREHLGDELESVSFSVTEEKI